MESAYYTKSAFNSRPGFSCYPIRTNECIQGNRLFTKTQVDQNKRQVKPKEFRLDPANAPLPDKSFKKGSVSSKQKKVTLYDNLKACITLKNQTQLFGSTIEKKFKSDLSEEQISQSCGMRVFDADNYQENKFIYVGKKYEENLYRQEMMSRYYASVVKNK
mmetsp:Transcript_26912/g.31079  ORF Transcript_26912/g.31079 Transcript_26912/m.31079 type:complete len:161 (-) Transcript_26912:16-498(-)